MDIKTITTAVIDFIIKNQPVTLDELQKKALTKSWYSADKFFTVIQKVQESKKIKATAKGDGIIYTERKIKTPTPKPRYTGYYPDTELGESPFLVCSCSLFNVHWSNDLGHFPDCDSQKHPDSYRIQNPWDYTASYMIDLEKYEKICNQAKARASYPKRNLSLLRK